MGRPEITDDQREMAVTMLANAIRKDSHLRARAQRIRNHHNPIATAMAEHRTAPSQRYVEGMRDLLRVLFVDGAAVSEECLERAQAQALGVDESAGLKDTYP